MPDPLNMTQGFNSKPETFRAEFKARSPQAEEVIRGEWEMEGKDINVIMDRIQQEQAAQRGKVVQKKA